jgi:hypothetical protein
VNGATTNLQVARNREQIAVTKDEDLKTKMRELTDHLNGLIDKPQVLIDKITRLGSEQLQTYRERRDHGEIVRQRQRELTDAQTALSIAQTEFDASNKDMAAIDAQIREVQGY